MKTMLAMLVALSLSMGVSAQRKGHVVVTRPRVIVVPSVSYGFGYGYPYRSPFYSYPFGYPYGRMYQGYDNSRVPYKLSLEIQSIKSDYKAQIKNVRKDKDLSHSARRAQIRSLKADRDKEIAEAARNFTDRPVRNQEYRRNSRNQNPGNDNSLQDNDNS